MRKIRILSVIVFALSLASFIFIHVKHSRIDDTVAPRISMEENAIEVSVADPEEVLLQGITATDSNDGDVSDTLIVESMGQFISDGKRNITIAAFDSSSNVSKVTREINYVDYTAPRFTLSGPLRFKVNDSNILAPLGAIDCLDGDLTRQIKVTASKKIKVNTAGDYETSFSVTNSAGDTVKLPCTVSIIDYSVAGYAPEFELSEYIVYTTVGESINPWKCVSAVTMDNVRYERDGDTLYSADHMNTFTRDNCSIKGNVDYENAGTYEYVLKTTDSRNRVGSIRLIVVVE